MANKTADLCWPLIRPGTNQELQLLVLGASDRHLNWQFSQSPPLVITQILQDCLKTSDGGTLPESEIWQWDINFRTQALLAITIFTYGSHCSLSVRCPQEACLEMMDIDLELSQLYTPKQSSSFGFSFIPDVDTEIKLRLPTGEDQQRWLHQAVAEQTDLSQHMARDLVLSVNRSAPEKEWRLAEQWLDQIQNLLAQHDLFTEFTLQTQCPNCGHMFEAGFDVEEYLLNILQDQWQQLLEDIHYLAASYHWSEQEIFSVPIQRRQYYLKCIHGEM